MYQLVQAADAAQIATSARMSGKTVLQQIHAAKRERDLRMQAAARAIAASSPITPTDQPKIVDAKQEWARLVAEKKAELDAREAAAQRKKFRESWCNMVRLAAFGRAPMTLAKIMDETCAKYSVTSIDIRSNRRTKNIIIPRFEVIWRARHETLISLPTLGRLLGNRDHTTILWADRTYERLRRIKAGLEPAGRYDRNVDFSKIIGE